jgi:threonine aldolase
MMNYQDAAQADQKVRIDLRSDTVTRPTAEMRAAMAIAEVGDDVYGDDPTVNALQARVAALLGKEAGLFVASGTQSNLCALLAHCQRGDELLVGDCYHVHRYEAGGVSVLGGVMMEALATDHRGMMKPDAITEAVKPDDPHCPISRLLCLENTVSGHVHDVASITGLASAGRDSGLAVHLDGARLMNAAVKLGVPACQLVEPVDSVSLCLSKGLGTPAGSVLVGSTEFIARARRMRKLVGGGMRQVGILAAAGLYALEHHIDRLADDHVAALRLADQLGRIAKVSVNADLVETNMVFMQLPEGAADPLRAHLAGRGILLGGGDRIIRIVTHLDIDVSAIDQFTAELADFFE